ncbi:prepilin-type N-terminal cleavage/methylation domain-containing protein [Morganella psychrotolerans]|uniref:Prepilin-type N-terminal cleavage/methylation domain-containing protein n=1 Tax=Morganella psychrotolerans TaxID=368603 RepID=A0A5M9R165_9GAMM|nr:prepilin-type N-terminal cleavage/methylation domain-containing protein [Morganella psychrotolerans]KAA8713999.1 prepilin-type N-terminal cleavage/methylation domain-containing protein [Morganella psychrotolerans]OBU03260.1 prepilin-type N-terminal cleavage/methylation domain-containing protein [Morganella psychrotolerans]
MNERGMSLPEVLICAFVFAVLMTGLLRYHQLLNSGKHRQYDDVRTVRRLHQLMRFTADPGTLQQMMKMPLSSRRQWENKQENVAQGCVSVTIRLVSSGERQLTASRWQCMQGQKNVYDLSLQ